ncbi:MAG: TetR/AcrR family transcriptional regulator [Campylobacteraceae bacterium]|nr:TetR/AcrR family transcriptional regulator [Campylobacteraceae bacterium]
MTKQEKLEQREKLILHNARIIVKKDGIFDFKMSVIAKAAKISIGTLYIHFQSKEDLVIALACDAIEEVSRFFTAINDLNFSNKEKLLAYTFASYARREKENYVSEIEQIVTNVSIRNRASKYRSLLYDNLLNQTTKIVEETIINLIKEENEKIRENEDLIKKNLLFGLWSLSLGSLSILQLHIFEYEELNIQNTFVQNCISLINTYEWNNKLNELQAIIVIEKTKILIQKEINC